MVSTGALVEAAPSPGWAGYAPLDAPFRAQLRAAASDVREGLQRWRGWTYLAAQTIQSSYRRTVLGPWWLTLQTIVLITGLALIFGHILNEPLKQFLPYVALGFIGFYLLTGLIRSGAIVFIGAANTMKSTRQPLSSHVLRNATIELVQFGHNIPIYLVFLTIGLVPLTPKALVAIPVVVMLLVNGVFMALWLGPTVARFRDVEPLVNSILQVSMFFTPIFYRPENLGPRQALIAWNPLTYLLDAFRSPLIGAPLELKDYALSLLITSVNIALGVVVFSRTRSRLPYWVA